MPNDPAIHLSGLGQNWRPMHLIAFSEGAYEQHCPEQVKSLVNDAPPTALKRIINSIVAGLAFFTFRMVKASPQA